MNLWKQLVDLVKTGTNVSDYYRNMNMALKRLNDEYTMLHFAMEGEDNSSFYQTQKNLTDFCMSQIPDFTGKHVLEIGCGNGIQAMYINNEYKPASMTGIDLDPGNIDIANSEVKQRQIDNMFFYVDDAQKLAEIKTNSMDIVVNIESAFHYPNKTEFLNQIARVLKPGGTFVIADLLTTAKTKGVGIRKLWKSNMKINHWKKSRYESELESSPLHREHSIDITPKVISGFKNYRRWIRDMNKFGFFKDIMFKMFYIINVKWTLYCLRRRREYFVFVGSKPMN